VTRLTVSFEDQPSGHRESHSFEGVPQSDNAGIPSKLTQSDGRLLVLRCANSTVQVHHAGARLRLQCDSSIERLDGWSDSPTSIVVVKCEQDVSSTIAFPSQDPIVFASTPLEAVNTLCCTYDVCSPYGDLRSADAELIKRAGL
jgi:hypothetical protein